MQVSSVARDYARVFYEVCEEKNLVDDILYQTKLLQNLHDDDINKVLTIPTISKKIKIEIVDSLHDTGYNQVVVNLLKILLENDQLSYFNEIMFAFQEIYQEKNDIKIVYVTSAHKLGSDTRDLIRESLEKKFNQFVVLLTSVDQSYIGGIKIEYDGKVLNNTISHHLEKLKQLKIN